MYKHFISNQKDYVASVIIRHKVVTIKSWGDQRNIYIYTHTLYICTFYTSHIIKSKYSFLDLCKCFLRSNVYTPLLIEFTKDVVSTASLLTRSLPALPSCVDKTAFAFMIKQHTRRLRRAEFHFRILFEIVYYITSI